MFSILQNFVNRLNLKKQKPALKPVIKNRNTENVCQEKTENKIRSKKSVQDKKITQSKITKLNKNNIPVIDEHTDLNKVFTDKDNKENEPPKVYVRKKKNKKRKKQAIRKKQTPFPVNKNGVPVLSNDEDLFKYFMDDENIDSLPKEHHFNKKKNIEKTPEENFEEMLEKSLAGKTREMILLEKNNGHKEDKPLRKNEIIKYYPLPQEELDLHGCTAAEALKENEKFIKKARHKGKRTLLIIVGKGTGTRGTPVLPNVIENHLLELKRKNIVLAYKWDKGIKRKSGALIVYLNYKGIKL